jgi:hypothetical protein
LLEKNFSWKATNGHFNWNVRRDVYAAITLCRDILGNRRQLSKLGQQYAENPAHADWKLLSPAEFKTKYVCSKDTTKFVLFTAQINGMKVLELTA